MKFVRHFILFLSTLFCLNAIAQSAQRAEELFLTQQYADALQQYEGLLRHYPQNQLYQYRYARCLQELGDTEKAIHWFEVAGERYALRNYHLATLYAKQYRFDDAVVSAEKFLLSVDEQNDRYVDAEQLLLYAKKASRYLKRVEDIAIIDSVVLPKHDFLRAYQRLSADCGSLSQDSLGVVYTNARGDRRLLTGTDASGKQLLLSCQRLLSEWSECDTLPEPVNQYYCDTCSTAFPYMLADGITLYFASQAHDGLGGYDLYLTRYNPSTDSWLTPENIGFPFNSPANDYMLAIDEQQHIGIFATDRRTKPDEVAVYSFELNEQKQLLQSANDQYVRLAAQLLTSRTAQAAEPSLVTLTHDIPDYTTDSLFRLVINDSTIYSRLQDFRSEEARLAAEEYVALEQQIFDEEQSLQEMRTAFGKQEDDIKRAGLRSVILTQEKTLQTMLLERKALLKKIRQAENLTD